MNILKILLVCFYFISVNASGEYFQAFSKEALLKQQHENKGKRWLMLLWSVDCPPCYKELALLRDLRKQYDLWPIIIINTDDNDDISEERAQVIKQFKLDDLLNLYFVDSQGAYNRYSIDPHWHGELPRSYFIDEQGKVMGQSGLLNKKLLLAWLKK